MPIRIAGMNSGLDTDKIITELVSAYKMKSEKFVKAQKKLSWKQTAWSALNTKVSSFYGSLNSLKFSSGYNMKTANISNSTKATVTASSSAVNGSYSLKILKTAKTGYLTGAELNHSLTAESTLADLGYTGGNGTISVTGKGGKTSEVEISESTNIRDFVEALNNQGVKASFDATNHRIFVASSEAGANQDFSMIGLDSAGWEALTKLGLNVGTSTADKERYKNLAAYALNTAGMAYITGYNADGTAITAGTYDEAKTKQNIDDILKNLTDASTAVTNKGAQIAYANAFKTVREVDSKIASQDVETLNALIREKDLSAVYVDANGKLYDRLNDGTYTRREDKAGFDDTTLASQGLTLTAGTQKLLDIEVAADLAQKEIKADGTESYTVNDAAVTAYKNAGNTVSAYRENPENDAAAQEVATAYANGSLDTLISTLQNDVRTSDNYLKQHSIFDNPSYTADNVTSWIQNAVSILDGTTGIPSASVGVNGESATRVNGEDAVIVLNNATYTSTSNTFTINGMTIQALAATGNRPEDEVTITVGSNTQGLYDKVKDFLKQYNELINEMTSLYNADMAKGMEPLTSDEKDAMSDTEVKEWEDKIKKSLLRRDDSLGSIMNLMKSAMMKSFKIDGKNYSLASFGIKTLGVLNAKNNEENAYHIDGNADDPAVSGQPDKLMAALSSDPDTVIEFMKKLTSELSDNIYKKMKSSSLSSFNYVYNDKQMAKEYSDYTTTIKKWEDKLAKMEDSYYKKFAAMEKALASLQGQQSSLANMLS